MQALPTARTRLKDLAALLAPDPALKIRVARKAQGQILRSAERQATPKLEAKAALPAPSAGRRPRSADLQSQVSLASLGLAWVRQLQVNAGGALSSDAPEYVHQLRVGLRRLRCLFGVLMDGDAARSDIGRRTVQDELRWIAGVLGECRDWDVFAAELLPVAVASLSQQEAVELRRRTARMRSVRRKALRTALGSARFVRLPAMVEAVLAMPLRELPAAAQRDITVLVAEAMHRRSTRACRWARRPDRKAPEKLHRLRIEIKKLRYLGEMIAPCHPDKAAKEYLKSVTELQSALGRMQDITTARQMIRTLACTRTSPMPAVLPAMDSALADRLAKVLEDITEAARGFRQMPAFWCRGA
jgi:CHAD domain-containing protein